MKHFGLWKIIGLLFAGIWGDGHVAAIKDQELNIRPWVK